MAKSVATFITRWDFFLAYQLGRKKHYELFLEHVNGQIALALEADTELVAFSIARRRKDQAGNLHVPVRGTLNRKEQTASIGAQIVWLKKLSCFRGNFWSDLPPAPSDQELFMQARSYFYAENYIEFLSLSKRIDPMRRKSTVFKKMTSIAQRHASQS